jgi:transposase
MVAAVKITLTDHTAMELRGLAAKSNDAAQVRRLLALALILEGQSRHTAATQSGMDRQTLRDWVHRYNTEGVSGLLSIRSGGHPASLTAAQMAELKELTIKGPDPETDNVVGGVAWSRSKLARSPTQEPVTKYERNSGVRSPTYG